MGLHTGTVRNVRRAPYRVQVLAYLIGWGLGETLSDKEEEKVARVSRFLPAQDCAREIGNARGHRDLP